VSTVDSKAAVAGLAMLHMRIQLASRLALQDAMNVAVASAKGADLFKDRTGLTRRSIQSTSTGHLTGVVRAGGAAHFLEYGTRPHLIVARNGVALRFMVNGAVIFRRSVNHPGTSPRPFMQTARARAALAAGYAADLRIAYAIEHG